MFYKSQRLDQFLTPSQRALVEEDVNQWIHRSGHVVYGNVDKDGDVSGFSTEKGDHDFWVGFLIGLKMMGNSEPAKAPIAIEKVDDETRIQAMMDANRELKRQLEQRK